MIRTVLVAVLLFAGAGKAEGVEAASVPQAPRAERAGLAIWTASFMDWGLLLVGPILGVGLNVALPVGVNVPLTETTDGVFELRPMLARTNCTNIHGDAVPRCGTLQALRATVGLAWTPWPGERGDGFFIQPKLSGMVTHQTVRGTEIPVTAEGTRMETGGQVSLGFDVGYRKTSRRSRSFLAPVIGVGVGYSWNQQRRRVDPGWLFARQPARGWKDKFIVDLNLDLLRFGATF
ncbi:hypothetical protein [Myxococcus virescens]|nr:hypothetical protein [Myxococcus virescens]SDE75111.1 hypothetical protein SAMN04488504_11131 [Myxococcus virescens]